MQPERHTFPKKERLCSKKQIEALFSQGRSLMSYPVRVQYLLVTAIDDSPSKTLFSVPKKRFKRAVKRNLIRRRMRESFRLNKHLIYPLIPEGKQLLSTFVYIDNTVLDYKAIEKGVLKAFDKLVKELGRAVIEETQEN